jgi:predicted ABC-type ATPase
MAPPVFYVVAGPNGSGKTTFALNDPALKSVPFINADIEAQRLSPGSPAKAALAAGRLTLANIAREISARRAFALETTLSGLSTLEAMRRALAVGYLIDLTYVCLSSPRLNVARVAMRVSAGGHHVPEQDVLRRYARSLQNLPAALSLAERARVIDNTDSESRRLVLEIREQQILFVHPLLPDWLKTVFKMESAVADEAEHIGQQLQKLRQSKQ